MTFIRIDDLIKVYNQGSKNAVSALRGIKLDIEKESLITLLGPSGCGKSTLMNLVAIFEKPTAGKISIEGIEDIYKLKERERIVYHQEKVGYMSQFVEHNLLPEWTVENNIRIPITLRNKLSREERVKRVDELLTMVNLEDKKKQKVNKLSGGEAQRISLVTALANDPQILLVDEPTGELDSKNTIIMGKLLQNVAHEKGKIVLAVTHNPILAELSDISWKMSDGRLTELYKKGFGLQAKVEQVTYSTFVDSDGNLRLPSEILEKAHIKNSVSVDFNEKTKKVELTPEDT